MSQLPITRVLIVGGGIGGLATAIALGKLGIKTEIAEVKQDWQVYGVGIFQPPNALRALNELNVAKRCLEEGYSFEGMAYCDAEGNRFAEPESPKIAGYPGLNVISRKNSMIFFLKRHCLTTRQCEWGQQLNLSTI
ncbi:FAD-dependent monooxygenase [Halobacillus sp. BAB-2008]|uniref:FAD-dependent monooxygenase n=1 Tax=Halobacillus sp. BAB-2008 TaxID=1246484 RepID=UPI00030A4FC1|nr:FAD-dependent monooxygenase [Halobacillus sp. BAB-2008]